MATPTTYITLLLERQRLEESRAKWENELAADPSSKEARRVLGNVKKILAKVEARIAAYPLPSQR